MAAEQQRWTPKDPDTSERFSVDWAVQLSLNEYVDGQWEDDSPLFELLTAAGLTITEAETDARYSTARFDGGTAGQVAVIRARVRTTDGNEIEDIKTLEILSTESIITLGDYEVPGVDYFVARYPRFAGVPYDVVQGALTEGSERVATSWKMQDYPRGIMLYAAHVLTLDGQGTGTEASIARDGLSSFQIIKSGGLSLQRFDGSNSQSGFKATAYGQRFMALLRLNTGGARVVVGSTCSPCSPFANDCP